MTPVGSKKKASKAKTNKRLVSKPSSKPASKSTTTAHVQTSSKVSDGAVFTTQPEQPSTITVPKGKVQLFVKGSDYGQVETNGFTVGQMGVEYARRNGIKTFSLYADGVKVEPGDKLANAKADSVAKLEVVPKDSRG